MTRRFLWVWFFIGLVLAAALKVRFGILSGEKAVFQIFEASYWSSFVLVLHWFVNRKSELDH